MAKKRKKAKNQITLDLFLALKNIENMTTHQRLLKKAIIIESYL